MKYIGNILTKTNVNVFSEFINITDSVDNIDWSLPTLIIGRDEAKDILGEDFSSLNHETRKNVIWTFKPKERRNEYERDYNEFKRIVIKELFKNIQYQYFNIFTSSCHDIKSVIKFIRKKKSIIFVLSDMIYLLYNQKIIGFSMRDAEYIGIPRQKIINLIKGNTLIFNSNFLSDVDKSTFYGNNIVIPYLYSLKD